MDIRSACRHAVRKHMLSMKCWKSWGGLNFFLPCERRGKYYIDFTFISCWWVLFMSVIFSLGGGLRLVALFNSGPSRFT